MSASQLELDFLPRPGSLVEVRDLGMGYGRIRGRVVSRDEFCTEMDISWVSSPEVVAVRVLSFPDLEVFPKLHPRYEGYHVGNLTVMKW